jgi:hypothetical protein
MPRRKVRSTASFLFSAPVKMSLRSATVVRAVKLAMEQRKEVVSRDLRLRHASRVFREQIWLRRRSSGESILRLLLGFDHKYTETCPSVHFAWLSTS